jgi:hypothetical protein
MRSAVILAGCAALVMLACGHYSAPVRPPAIIPDAGPVYDAGQPPETAAERRAARAAQRGRRTTTAPAPAVVPAPPPVAPPEYPVAPPPEPPVDPVDPAQVPTP